MFSKQIHLVFRALSIKNTASNVTRSLCTSDVRSKERVTDRKEMLKSLPSLDEGVSGEKTFGLELVGQRKAELFPTIDTPNKLFNGIPFKKLPIFNIKVTKNNTIINLTDSDGTPKLIRSCGIEGFKHTKKGTNIAAQTTAVSIGTRALEQGIKTIRVRVRGLGPGRMAAIKGLQLSGLEIVSITDYTRVSWNPPRPRKAKRL